MPKQLWHGRLGIMNDEAVQENFKAFCAHIKELGYTTKRTYGYYATYALLVAFGIGLGIYFLTLTTNIFLQSLNAVFLAFVLVQGGILGHDLSHGQVFVSKKVNRVLGILVWGVMAGLSESKWFEKHNAHHKYTNQMDHDPDLDMPFMFSDEQKPSTSKTIRFLQRYQHILFFLVLPLIYFSFVSSTFLNVVRHPTLRSLGEMFLIAIHFLWLFFVIFSTQSLLTGSVFLLINTLCVGLYMSLIFAPNHKGEEVIPKDAPYQWKYQITSTRNLNPSKILFVLLGGLTLQIEHHLFPSMARPHYLKIHTLTKEFCKENSIRYHETSWGESFIEIYRTLKHHSKRAFV